MSDLQKFRAKVCLTACGWLLYQQKVLLIHHKKLDFWLAPGGHIEDGELPHVTAEREFWEEAGIKVRAFSKEEQIFQPLEGFEILPHPFYTNLHWVCKENYDARMGKGSYDNVPAGWRKRGCEQHLGFSYFVKPVDSVKFKQNVEETLGISWFSREEIETLNTPEQIKQEARFVFEQYPG